LSFTLKKFERYISKLILLYSGQVWTLRWDSLKQTTAVKPEGVKLW
jgi:hypothetical protein